MTSSYNLKYFEKPSASRINTKVACKERKERKEVQSYAKNFHITILKVTSQIINPLVYTIFSVVYLFIYY